MQENDQNAHSDEEQQQTVIADIELMGAVKDLRHIRSQKAYYRKKELSIMGLIEMKMGDKPLLIDEHAQLLLTYKYSKDGYTFDTARFKAEKPTMYKNYLKSKPGTRTLLLKGESSDD